MQDKVGFSDSLHVGVGSEAVPPRFPCAKCGSETKEHHPVLDSGGKVVSRQRICSRPDCREVIALS